MLGLRCSEVLATVAKALTVSPGHQQAEIMAAQPLLAKAIRLINQRCSQLDSHLYKWPEFGPTARSRAHDTDKPGIDLPFNQVCLNLVVIHTIRPLQQRQSLIVTGCATACHAFPSIVDVALSRNSRPPMNISTKCMSSITITNPSPIYWTGNSASTDVTVVADRSASVNRSILL